MANQSYFSQYGNTTLHTNYHYFRPNLFLKNVSEALQALNHVEGNIDTLEAKEMAFYQKFGKNSYEEFMEFFRAIMSSHDGAILKKASNENIRKHLLREINRKTETDMTQINMEIIAKNDDAQRKLDSLNSLIVGSLSRAGFTVSGQAKYAVSGNIQTMKQIINRIASKNMNPRSINADALAKILNETGIDSMISFSVDGADTSAKRVSDLIKFRPYPWGYTNAELRQALQEDGTYAREEMSQAILDIKKNVKEYFGGGSEEFNRALDITLNHVLPDGGYNIFMIGSNVEAGLIGAFGEFGTALLLQYLYQLTGENLTEPIAQVVGQTLGKQDVKVFDAFGIQVKNYSINQGEFAAFTRKNIDVKQHPDEVAQYFSNAQSFTGFLANYFFNSNIATHYMDKIYDLEDALAQDYTAELLRFAVADIPDTVCFYNIGQQFFVPASRILRFYSEQAQTISVHISGGAGPKWTGGVSRGPNEYWERVDGRWAPTKHNLSVFGAYTSKHITIQATMTRLNIGAFGY